MMTKIIYARDAAGVIGALLIAIGIGMIYPPAGVITGGVLMLGGAIALAKARWPA
jgi:hypothetical protein